MSRSVLSVMKTKINTGHIQPRRKEKKKTSEQVVRGTEDQKNYDTEKQKKKIRHNHVLY